MGGGDSAMEEAIYLTKFCSKVTIVHRRDSFRASKIMQERALSNKKIDVMWNSSVVDMIGEPDKNGLESVLIEDLKEGDLSSHTGMIFDVILHPNTLIEPKIDSGNPLHNMFPYIDLPIDSLELRYLGKV